MASKRVLLVAQVDLPATQNLAVAKPSCGSPHPLDELGELARSAGLEVCGRVVLRRNKSSPTTFIGSGQAQKIGERVAELDASLVIVDHALSPIQERNLARIVGCRVLDRSALILDIFAQRATSREGKLQVELAQLSHLSTRLVRGWSHLERQKGGVGLRGPGETQLETDRRLIKIRMRTLARALQKLQSQRGLRRRARRRADLPVVSLVGYTNSGKSSLFNALVGLRGAARVRTADQLFATLDPTMRRLDIGNYGNVLLSDTVGFIRELPHEWVAAFRSTLEELRSAACLVLVNDCHDPEAEQLKAEVERVLDEIGAGEVPRIYVHNKIDLRDAAPKLRYGVRGYVEHVWLSARNGDGVELLAQALSQLLGRHRQRVELRLRPHAGALRAQLYARCEVVEEYADQSAPETGTICLTLNMGVADLGWLKSRQEFNDLWWQP